MKVFKQYLKDNKNLPNNNIVGMKQLCLKKYLAYMALSEDGTIMKRKLPCKILQLDVFSRAFLAAATNKSSPYNGLLRY